MDAYEGLNKLLNEVLSKIYDAADKPDYLFHYTSQAALRSMISKGELWLSSIRSLNDTREGVFGLETIRRLVEAMGPTTHEIVETIETYQNRNLVESFLEYRRPTFLMSFTSQEDSLSDWINYGDGGSGISIKFKRPEIVPRLNQFLADRPFRLLLPTFYFEDAPIPNTEQSLPLIEGLKVFSIRLLELLVDCPPENKGVLKALAFESMMVFSSMIKSTFHKQEHEWRLIVRLEGPGVRENVDVEHMGKLRSVYKIHFPEQPIYPGSTETVSSLGSLVHAFWTGPKVTGTSVANAIRTLTYNRWADQWPVHRSAGMLEH